MNKKQPTKNESGFELKDFFVSFIENFIKKIGEEIISDIKEKAHAILEQLKKKTVSVFLMVFGFIFFIVGVSIFLENFLPLNGLGFLIVGFIIFLLGYIINIKKQNGR